MNTNELNKAVLAAYPAFTLPQIEALNDDEKQRLLTEANDQRRADLKAEREAEAEQVAKVERERKQRLLEPPGSTSPLRKGHKIAPGRAIACSSRPGPDEEPWKRMPRDRIAGPGDIVELEDFPGGKESWNAHVAAGRIVLDPDLPDPGKGKGK